MHRRRFHTDSSLHFVANEENLQVVGEFDGAVGAGVALGPDKVGVIRQDDRRTSQSLQLGECDGRRRRRRWRLFLHPRCHDGRNSRGSKRRRGAWKGIRGAAPAAPAADTSPAVCPSHQAVPRDDKGYHGAPIAVMVAFHFL